MKFSCDKYVLQQAAASAARAAAAKSPIPTLEGLLIEAGASVRITGYDLKKAIYTTIDADIPEPGSVLIGARLFCEMLRRMPDGIVTVEAENGTVSVKCGKAAFNLVGLSADDYPDLPTVEAQNGVKKTAAELAGTFAAVLFCPDDLNIIRDGPATRRRMMDMAISQLRPKYGALLAEYSRLYDQKSAILRDWHEKPSLLDTLDDFSDQMCRVSAKLIRYRAAYASRLNIAAAPIHADFSGGRDKLTLAYRTVSTVEDALGTEKEIYYALCDHQEQHRRAELDSGQCLTGAHKDDLIISINGQSARAFASQGQTRTAALSLKLAEREIFHDEFDEYPVLMLDDVLSELDAQRQAFVLNRIGGGQTLITCCEDARIAERTGGRVLTVENGVIR